MADDSSAIVLTRLQSLILGLGDGKARLLLEMAEAISSPIAEELASDSDIVTNPFAENFATRLRLHHATSEEKFKKKSFEYAFTAAAQASGRNAQITNNPTHPGADVMVDGCGFSLKTEASANLSQTRITISKLTEARWIRECRSSEDFCSKVRARVCAHLRSYQRILMLRASGNVEDGARYDLVEIPVALLQQIEGLAPQDFSARTANGSSSAGVMHGGEEAFRLRLDGSVEKVTISGLLMEHCKVHASWTIPSINRGDAIK